jgi:hypothetical protein
MGGRLFPTGNERELGVDTDDRAVPCTRARRPGRASGVRWTRRSLVADDGALESGSVVRDHGLCRACRWRTRRVRRASFKAADTPDLDPCAWLRAVLGAAIEEVRGSARVLTGRRGVAVDLPTPELACAGGVLPPASAPATAGMTRRSSSLSVLVSRSMPGWPPARKARMPAVASIRKRSSSSGDVGAARARAARAAVQSPRRGSCRVVVAGRVGVAHGALDDAHQRARLARRRR